MHGFNGFGGGWMMVFWWGLIIAAIFVLFRLIANRGSNPLHNQESALDILKRRYAKGEIDKNEFEEKKEDLLN
ncbi:MAG: SHOCT domain-containing protein [Balneolaceae bacterium]|nr:SHOCT domain-containing protein [Balneolaceae bacterium]